MVRSRQFDFSSLAASLLNGPKISVARKKLGTKRLPPIDAAGQLPDGRTFADVAGLKQHLVADSDLFATAFSEKLATYALRRGMTFSDRAELSKINNLARVDGYKLTTVIEALVTSELGQKR